MQQPVCPKDSRWWWWRTRPLWMTRANWCVHLVRHCDSPAAGEDRYSHAHVFPRRVRCRTWPSALWPRIIRAEWTCSACAEELVPRWQYTMPFSVFHYCALCRCDAGAVAGAGCGLGLARFSRAVACEVLVGGLAPLPLPGFPVACRDILHFCRMRLDARKPFSGTCQCKVACLAEACQCGRAEACESSSCRALKWLSAFRQRLKGAWHTGHV